MAFIPLFPRTHRDSRTRICRCVLRLRVSLELMSEGYGCESYQALAGIVDIHAPGPGETLVKGAVSVVQNMIFSCVGTVVYSGTRRVGYFRRDRCANCLRGTCFAPALPQSERSRRVNLIYRRSLICAGWLSSGTEEGSREAQWASKLASSVFHRQKTVKIVQLNSSRRHGKAIMRNKTLMWKKTWEAIPFSTFSIRTMIDPSLRYCTPS